MYRKGWVEAPLAAEDPVQDLALGIDLSKYQAINPDISLAARKVDEHQLWYLSDDAVGLAFFSDRLPSAEKLRIVDGMTRQSGVRNVRSNAAILKENVRLMIFASERTTRLMSRLQIGETFLALPPEMWSENGDYIL